MTPLMEALNEKYEHLIERLIREFKDSIEFE